MRWVTSDSGGSELLSWCWTVDQSRCNTCSPHTRSEETYKIVNHNIFSEQSCKSEMNDEVCLNNWERKSGGFYKWTKVNINKSKEEKVCRCSIFDTKKQNIWTCERCWKKVIAQKKVVDDTKHQDAGFRSEWEWVDSKLLSIQGWSQSELLQETRITSTLAKSSVWVSKRKLWSTIIQSFEKTEIIKSLHTIFIKVEVVEIHTENPH